MIDTAEAVTSPPHRPRRRRRRTVAAVTAAVLVIACAVVAWRVANHYRDAPLISADGGGWMAPDNTRSHWVDAGPYSASIAPPRPGHPQTFEIEVYNPASVTQTIVGLAYNEKGVAEPDHLLISAVDTAVGDSSRVRYIKGPISIRPHGVRTLHFTHDTAAIGWGHCRSEFWTDLSLRVRVGWFTRTETVSLGNMIIELHRSARGCQ